MHHQRGWNRRWQAYPPELAPENVNKASYWCIYIWYHLIHILQLLRMRRILFNEPALSSLALRAWSYSWQSLASLKCTWATFSFDYFPSRLVFGVTWTLNTVINNITEITAKHEQQRYLLLRRWNCVTRHSLRPPFFECLLWLRLGLLDQRAMPKTWNDAILTRYVLGQRLFELLGSMRTGYVGL